MMTIFLSRGVMQVDRNQYVTRKEAAKIFECAPTTYWSWALDGRAPGKCFRVGCIDYYNKQELLDFKSKGGIVGFKTGRKKGYRVIQTSVEEDTDLWMIQKKQACFSYDTIYFNFITQGFWAEKFIQEG